MTLPITDPVLIFGLTMILILVMPLLFRRLKVPGLVGLILAGAAVGPNALGLLARDATFELLGTVGLLYLMFTAGLSIDLNQFNKLRQRSLLFGLVSFFLPQMLAVFVAGPLLGYSLPASLLLGSIVGSHTLVAYPIAARFGITRNPGVTMVMGGTMVTDLISLLILAIVEAQVSGQSGVAFWLLFVVLVLAFGLAVAFGLPWLGRWFYKNVRHQADAEFVFLLAMVFVTAYLASVVRLAPIIGAFLAGLAFNRLVPEQSSLMTRIRFVGNALLIPFFLISVGMLVDFAVMFTSLRLWVMVLLFSGAVIIGKSLAAILIGWKYKHNWDERWTMIGLTVPQAAATLAVTIIGFELGLFDQEAVNAVVVMILLTCLLGASLVEKFGRAVALHEDDRPYEPSDAPQRILVPLANPETVGDLVDLALLIRNPASDQPIYPLTIARGGIDEAASVAASEKLLSHAILHASGADAPVKPLTRIDVSVADGITRAIREERISTVVIGWNGISAARAYVFGTILDELLRESQSMVYVCRIVEPLNTAGRIVVAIPPHAEREPGFPGAVRALKLFANQTGAPLLIVSNATALPGFLDRFRSTRPNVPVESQALDAWSHLTDMLDALIKPHDLLVLLAVRPGSVAWRPSLDRLPRVLASRFSTNSFVINYPSLVLPSSLGTHTTTSDSSLAAFERVETLALDSLTGDDQDEPLRALLTAGLGRDAVALEAVLHLMQHDMSYAPELLPGAVLFHAHTAALGETLLLAGLSEQGIRLPRTAHPVHVVLVLLAPAELPPERHLAHLAALVQLIRAPEAVVPLRSTALTSLAEEIARVLPASPESEAPPQARSLQ